MKNIAYIIVAVLFYTNISAQNFWVKPKKEMDKWCFTDKSTGTSYFCDSTTSLQNFNPMFSLDE